MRTNLFTFAILALFFNPAYGQRILSKMPDTLFLNGKVITIDAESNISEAFAVKDGYFYAVGTSDEIRGMQGPDTKLIDLKGHTVIPGLMDNHNHQYHTALLSFRGVNIRDITSLTDMFDQLAAAVTTATPGETIYTTIGWSASNLVEKRGPTREELDNLAPNNPVIVYANRNRLHVNQAALEALGVAHGESPPPLVSVDRDSSGLPTGLIIGEAPFAVMGFAARLVPQPSLDEKKELISQMQKEQHAMGLTGIRDLQLFPDEMRAYYELWLEDKITMRVSIGLEFNAGEEDRLESMLAPWGIGPGFGNEWLRIDGIAEYNPGVQLREPYTNSNNANIGKLRLLEQDFIQAIRTINHYGWRPSIHVMGDKTLDLVLDAYEQADKDRSIKSRRWIVEHIPLVHKDQMQRMKQLGVMVSAQFQPYSRASSMVQEWGRARTERALPMRDLLDFGIIVSGGSDWPGAPNNPFINIYYYVTRDTLDLGPVGVDQRISRQEAIRVMSLNNAYLTYEENIKGSIEPGKLADFVVLSRDILSIPESQLRDIYPLATYVSGRNVYMRPDTQF